MLEFSRKNWERIIYSEMDFHYQKKIISKESFKLKAFSISFWNVNLINFILTKKLP